MSLDFINGNAIISLEDTQGVINDLGEIIIPLSKCSIELLENGLIKVFQNFETFSGKNYIENWHEAGSKGGVFTLYGHQGKKVNPTNFNFISDFDGCFAIVNIGGSYSFTSFDYGQGFSEEINGGKYGIIDNIGQNLVNVEYDSIIKVNTDIFLAKKNDMYFLMNSKGVEIVKNTFESAKLFSAGYTEINNRSLDFNFTLVDYILVSNNNKFGLLDTKGNEIIPLRFTNIFYLPGTNVFVTENEKYGIYSSEGKEIISPQLTDIRVLFYDDLVAPEVPTLFDFYIDIDEYSDKQYSEKFWKYGILKTKTEPDIIGLKLLSDNGWCFFNTQTKNLFTHSFENIFVMNESYLLVLENNKYGLIDFSGNTILKCNNDGIFIKNDNLFRVKRDSKVGEINMQEDIITPFKSDEDLDDRIWIARGQDDCL